MKNPLGVYYGMGVYEAECELEHAILTRLWRRGLLLLVLGWSLVELGVFLFNGAAAFFPGLLLLVRGVVSYYVIAGNVYLRREKRRRAGHQRLYAIWQQGIEKRRQHRAGEAPASGGPAVGRNGSH